MRTISHITGFIILLAVAAGSIACSVKADTNPQGPRNLGNRDSVKKGEYLITTKDESSCNDISEVYKNHTVIKCTKIRGNLFLIAFDKDPGLETVTSTGKKSGKVERAQPNFRYRASPRKRLSLPR